MDSKQKPTLLILRGAPGTGKTEYAEFLRYNNGYVAVSADDSMTDRYGRYVFDPKNLDYAHNQCFEKARLAISQGRNVVVHNTMRTNEEVYKYRKIFPMCNLGILKMTKEHGTSKNIPYKIMRKHREEYEPFDIERFERRGTFDRETKKIVFEE